MSDQQYPCLGFDPARGNVGTVRDLAQQMTDTSVYAREAHDVLTSVKNQSDVWTGQGAQAFADKLDDLPKYLDTAYSSLEQAGKALTTWTDQLDAHQERARELEEQARKAIAAAEQADAAAERANTVANQPIAYDTSDPASAQAAKAQAQANADAAVQANRAAAAAWDKVDDIRRQAQNLRDTWESDGRTCAEALRQAGEAAPDEGIFESIGSFVVDHLGEIGDIAGAISAIAGALAFIPFLAPIAGPVALIAGGVALAAHGADMVKEGDYSLGAWVGLGTDLLGVVPGVGAAARGASLATDSLRTVDGLLPAAEAGTRAFLSEAGRVAEPAKVFEKLGGKAAEVFGGNADTIAKSVQNTLNVGTQAPVMADMFVGNESTGAVKDVTGYVSGANAAVQSPQAIKDAGSAVGELGSSMSRFVGALG